MSAQIFVLFFDKTICSREVRCSRECRIPVKVQSTYRYLCIRILDQLQGIFLRQI